MDCTYDQDTTVMNIGGFDISLSYSNAELTVISRAG